jgi:hypothetical protein
MFTKFDFDKLLDLSEDKIQWLAMGSDKLQIPLDSYTHYHIRLEETMLVKSAYYCS